MKHENGGIEENKETKDVIQYGSREEFDMTSYRNCQQLKTDNIYYKLETEAFDLRRIVVRQPT